jgi:hypothetical protein
MFRFQWVSLSLCLLAACSSTSPPNVPILEGEPAAILFQIEEWESSSFIEAAPSLLILMQDPDRNLAMRARAAGALAVLGFPKGTEFCLGLLTAGLEGAEKQDKRLAIPFSNRMAFARELAIRSMTKVLQKKKGVSAPFFSANFGAPDLRKAEQQWRSLLGSALKNLPPPQLLKRIPSHPPTNISSAKWASARKLLAWKVER